jgi:DNA-binding response OmpR family regulator
MTEEVLLLDDDLTTLTFLDGVLSGAGFKCSSSGDPQQALPTFVQHGCNSQELSATRVN